MDIETFAFQKLASLALLASLSCSACNDENRSDRLAPAPWSWIDLGSPGAATSQFVSNQELLVTAGDDVLLGTNDGVWRRPLLGEAEWVRAGLEGLSILALTTAANGNRVIATVFDTANEMAPTAWYSTDQGTSWTSASTWPRGAPDSPMPNISFPIYALEPDPADPDVIYGALDADTLAVTVDGGANWILTDGATDPNFGVYCVPHLISSSAVLMQGCEIPLDEAWVGARTVVEADRFQLPDFRRLYGFPDDEVMGNRRVNAIASPEERDDYVLVGVEGGLVALTSASGEWTGRSDVSARWIFRKEIAGADLPYPYIRAIVALDARGRNLLFGGATNGSNDELSLFEKSGANDDVWQLDAPLSLNDPRVEQVLRLESNDLLVVISELDSQRPDGLHSPNVYRLQRP